MRHLLTLDTIARSDIDAIIARAQDMALFWREQRMPYSLRGKKIALVVDDSGWRNTTAFDLGITAMAGTCIQAPIKLDGAIARDSGQASAGEDAGDLARYLGNWFDAVVIRTPQLARLRELADAAALPVINARTKQNHPCEILGDLAFFHHRHRRHPKTIAFVGPDANILGSWIEVAKTCAIPLVQIYPERWQVKDAARLHAHFRTSTAMNDIRDADLVVTDCWLPDADASVQPYQITASLLDRLSRDAEFIPCPPVHRGKEVSADAMMHPKCRVTEAKAFLLHAQNAMLEWVLETG